MSLVAKLFPQRSNAITMESPIAEWLTGGSVSKANVAVNAKTALGVTTVFDCLRVISDGIAQVPLKIYKSEGENKNPASDHPLYNLLYLKPNEWQTSFEFRENMIFQAALLGNFFAFKNRVRGQVKSLIPFEPNTVTIKVDDKTRKLSYDVSANGEQRNFPAELIWHVRGPTWNTYEGMQAIKYAREAIGLAINIEESQNSLHASGVQTSGIYSVKGNLSEKQSKDLTAWIEKSIGGANRFRPFVIDREATFHPVTMSGADAQTIENRRFQIEEICRAFRVMPIMIGQADKAATYASAEQMFLAHVTHTLMPWYTRLEQSIDCNLLSEQDRLGGFYSKFNANALMRGTSETRSNFYDKMYRMKAFNPNQILQLEDMNPYEGGNEYYVEPGSQSFGGNVESEPPI